jgi:nitroimidazol reductase NimA-like FMN-containing flavoprotein (pyridoxamine 5'-phosphate oxidase superfamily)
MRRREFSIDNEQEVQAFMKEISFGFLGMVGEDGWPFVIPLNFAYDNGNVYLHGSKIGEKMKLLKQSDQVTFNVAKEYAILPSYFTDPELACPATSYFKSVAIRGHASILQDLEQKARALSIFMEKLQPEGGYEPIRADDPRYTQRIQGVAVIQIEIESLQSKFKFGQNLKEKERDHLISQLNKRNAEQDEETIRLMKLYCPHHS